MSSSVNDKVINFRVCRICLSTNLQESVNLDGENNLLQIFEYCVGLKVTNKDVPHLFCNNCTISLKNYAQFKEKCVKSDLFWKSFTDLDLCYAENDSALIKQDIKIEPVSAGVEQKSDDVVHVIQIDLNNIKYFDEDKDSVDSNNQIDAKSVKYQEQLLNIKADDTEKHAEVEQKHIQINSVNAPELIDTCVDESYDAEINSDDVFCTATVQDEFERNNRKNGELAKSNIKSITKKVANSDVKTADHGDFMCTKCNRKYVRKIYLTKHMKYHCGKDKIKPAPKKKCANSSPFICGICEVVSSDKKALDHHLAEHYINNDLDCKQCKYRAYDLAALMRHRYTHCLSGIKRRKSCHLCDLKTQSSMSLEYHYRSEHLGMPGGLCTICNKTFTVFKSWKNHELAHKNLKLICHHCGRKFLYKNQIIHHLKTAHSNVMDFICDECGKGFKRLASLQLHKSSVHYKSGPVKCSHCDKLFKTPITLMEHMKYVANANKSFQCEVCNKCFASAYKLKQHLFWHTGEKPHCCDVCGSRYKAKGQLKIHLRVHTGERPYQCKICMKSYMDLKVLKRHERIHTGDTRPFKCGLCAKGFTTKGSMLKHRNVRHKNINEVKSDNGPELK